MSAKSNWKAFNGQMRQLIKKPENRLQATQDFVARERLFNQIHSEVEPEIERMKAAEDYATAGYRSQLENRGEIEPGSREVDFGSGYRLHNAGPQVN